MYEVELKVRASHDEVESRVRERSDDVRRVEQVDTYYDAPSRSFAETDEALRIRFERSDGRVTHRVTYKGPLVDDRSKTRKEHETGVDDVVEMAAILESLGYTKVATVEKDRTKYRIGRFTVTLDTVAGIGEFVEVETQGTEDEIESLRDDAAAVLESLGLDANQHLQTSYLELVLDQ